MHPIDQSLSSGSLSMQQDRRAKTVARGQEMPNRLLHFSEASMTKPFFLNPIVPRPKAPKSKGRRAIQWFVRALTAAVIAGVVGLVLNNYFGPRSDTKDNAALVTAEPELWRGKRWVSLSENVTLYAPLSKSEPVHLTIEPDWGELLLFMKAVSATGDAIEFEARCAAHGAPVGRVVLNFVAYNQILLIFHYRNKNGQLEEFSEILSWKKARTGSDK